MREKQQDVDLSTHGAADCTCMDGIEMKEILSIIEDVPLRVLVLMGMLFNMGRAQFDRAMREVGLTHSQVMVIAYLYKNRDSGRELTSHELEQVFHVSNPTMSGILKRLEKKGKIKRIPGKTDKRSKQLLLETSTDSFFRQMENQAKTARTALFHGISEEELIETETILKKLLHNMEQNIKEYDR